MAHRFLRRGGPRRRTLSAGVVVVRRDPEKGWLYLLLRAYQYWDFPKGMVEPGEQPLEAAIREVAEESTITDLHFDWGHVYKETPPYARGKVARYYIAETHGKTVSLPVNPELGRPEHDEYRWMTYEEARELVSPRVRPILDWAHAIVTGAKAATATERAEDATS